MSARSAAPSSRRAELFAQAGSEEKGGEATPSQRQQQQQQPLQQQAPQEEGDDSPLQLEHILGYAGEFRNNCILLPGESMHYVKGMGNLVCIESLLDAHDQQLLRGHDMPVCAVAASPSGALVASGQLGTVKFKGKAAPIFVWDAVSGKRLSVLRGLTVRVNVIAFSEDERFLCACGDVRTATPLPVLLP